MICDLREFCKQKFAYGVLHPYNLKTSMFRVLSQKYQHLKNNNKVMRLIEV